MKNNSLLLVLQLVLFSLFISNTYATTYTFTAATGDWNVATNWDNNAMPPNPIPTGDNIVISVTQLVLIPVGYTVDNSGLISIAPNDGVHHEGTLRVFGELNNTGQITTGRLEIYGTYNHNLGGSIASTGIVYVRPGGVFNVGTLLDGHYSLGNLGTLNVLPTGSISIYGTFTNIGTLVNNGTITSPVAFWEGQTSTIKGTGTFTQNFKGSATVASAISLGSSPSCLTFSGKLNNSAGGHKLSFQINGTQPCTDYSKLIVNDSATVGGTLEVNFGFMPLSGQTFQLIQAAMLSSSFNVVNIFPSTINATYSAGVLTVASVLSVEFSHFTVQKQAKTVQLDWQTASEFNTKTFDIERSSNGKDWVSVGVVPAFGSSTTKHFYTFNDATPILGINYYRLRVVDKDEKFTYSALKTVELAPQKAILKVYPNPTSGNITLELPKEFYAQKSVFEVFDMLGRCVLKQDIEASDSVVFIKLNLLQKGLYQMRLSSNRQAWTDRLVVDSDL